MIIEKIEGYEIIDSRGNPTVAAKVNLKNGISGFACVPSGASTGIHEAFELRDKDFERFDGKGVLKAVNNINDKINSVLKNKNVFDQAYIDKLMIEADGSENKQNFGANAILAVSLACARAAANALSVPLYRYLGGAFYKGMPKPMMNILNGGAHAPNNIDIQEFMISPIKDLPFSDSLRICCEIYHKLGALLKKKDLVSGVGDEGGFAPFLENDNEAIEYILEAVKLCGYEGEIGICLDIASSEWYKDGDYIMPKRKNTLNSDALIDMYENMVESYPLISIEDGLAEDDFEGWKKLTEKLSNRVQLVGDDLFATNTSRLVFGHKEKIANSILIKPNQIGTLSETFDVIRTADNIGYKTVISHRSGETEDSFIADLAVAVGSPMIKMGAPARSDRTSKYNRLIIIENELKNNY